jgi:ethanolamine utilization cobalamin adenosyltransferase
MMKTSLSGNRMVPKTDGRIRFRGLIDSLEAETIEAQILAASLGEEYYRAALGELLDCLRRILAAEVKESPFAMPPLFGLPAEELHRQTHNTAGAFGLAGHPLPSCEQGALAARLNTLRAHTREAELCALRALAGEPCPAGGREAAAAVRSDDAAPPDAVGDESPNQPDAPWREDLAAALNRLSSAFYWLFCRLISRRETPPGKD